MSHERWFRIVLLVHQDMVSTVLDVNDDKKVKVVSSDMIEKAGRKPTQLTPRRHLRGKNGMEALREHMKTHPSGLTAKQASEFFTTLGVSPKSAAPRLSDLKARGLAAEDVNGVWQLTAKGRL